MTRKEVQERNAKIMQFRGSALRVRGMIPDDIWKELNGFDKMIIDDAHKAYKEVIKILNSKAKCRHNYGNLFEDNKCYICGHIKYSRDGLGKAGTFL